jgi:hypothetical protein
MPSAAKRAQGYVWLMKSIQGQTLKDIAKEFKRDLRTVRKSVRTAANELLDEAQASAIKHLIPLAAEVFAAHLKLQIESSRTGVLPDLRAAERLLGALGVFDHPQLTKLPNAPVSEESEEPSTLEALMIRRKPIQPSLPVVKDITNGDKDKTPSED